MYVYILENYAYSDFEYDVLMHENKYTKSEFKEIVKEAMKQVGKTKYDFDFTRELFHVLREKYGFKYGDDIIPICHIYKLQKEVGL